MRELARHILGFARSSSKNPFARRPIAPAETYFALHREAAKRSFPWVDELEKSVGFRIEPAWLDEVALQTQVTVKKSKLNWQHGRLLYVYVRELAETLRNTSGAAEPVTVFETGTARGFSALCIAKALLDAGNPGMVLTVDPLPHRVPIYWNCHADAAGKQTREQLLQRWQQELSRLVFLSATSSVAMDTIHLPRIHFAFLDAEHSFDAVISEISFVTQRQISGDVIFFDDVTPGVYDGVVRAVAQLEQEGQYEVSWLGGTAERGYAVARRV